MNTLRTVPRVDLVKSAAALQGELQASRADGRARVYDPAVVQYRRARNLFSFFKEGLMNLYRARQDLNRTVFNGKRYVKDYGVGDATGKLIVRWSDYDRIMDAIARQISLVDKQQGQKKTHPTNTTTLSDYGLDITHSQLVEMVHLHREWYKVPLFGVLFLILEELSLPLVYLFPGMVPKTCVLPGLIERRVHAKRDTAIQKLANKSIKQGFDPLQELLEGRVSPWTIKEDDLALYCDAIGVYGVGSRDRRISIMRHIRDLAVLRHTAPPKAA